MLVVCIVQPYAFVHSCVAVWQDDHVDIITNDHGNRTTPSYVSFSGTECLVGDAAKSHANTSPINAIFNAKRLIGRKFSDGDVQSDIKQLPFKVENKGGKPVVPIRYRGETRTFVSLGF